MDSRLLLRPRTRRQLAAIVLTTVASGHALGMLQPPVPPAPVPTVQAEPAVTGKKSYRHYVALGDSFTAGPLVPDMRLDPLGCGRSTNNYPSMLAGRIGVRTLTDVSCGGARTDHMTAQQRTVDGVNPPQLDALSERTDLVTLSIGGNDESVVPGMIATCIRLAASDPSGSPCRDSYTDPSGLDELEPRIDRTVEKIHKVLSEINRRSPRATVVLVGYPRFVPAEGFCPQRIPFAYGDYAYVDEVTHDLNRALQGSADRFGATYVDTYGPSRHHDPCSARPWVNGKDTETFAALSFHPFRAGMTAVAELVQRATRAHRPAWPPVLPLPQPKTATEEQVRRLATQLDGGI